MHYITKGQNMEIKDRLKSMYYNCSYIDRLKRTLERDREQLGIFPEYLAELERIVWNE